MNGDVNTKREYQDNHLGNASCKPCLLYWVFHELNSSRAKRNLICFDEPMDGYTVFFQCGRWPLRRCSGAMNEIEIAVVVVGGRQLKRVTHTQESGARWGRPQKQWHRKVLNYWDFHLVRLFTQ